jgi:hypothetical protein
MQKRDYEIPKPAKRRNDHIAKMFHYHIKNASTDK